MANTATVGILRVLLTGNSAELEAAYKKSTSATKEFINELKLVQKESQTAGQALTTALGKALGDAEKGTKGFITAAKQLSGIDLIGQANAYAKAVEAIGGASKLTEAEQKKINATLTEALAKYQALGREAPASLHALAKATAQVQEPTDKLGSTMGGLVDQVKASALGFLSAQAIIGAVQGTFRALTDFVKGSIAAYAETEAAQKKMTTALQASGRATPDVIKSFTAMSSAFQKTTVYGDDLITSMQGLLTEMGIAPESMQGALDAATNLASGLGIDLESAVKLVGKALEGNVGALKRYGIQIDEAKVKTEGASAVLSAIQQRFGGQAQAELDTYAGKIKQLANVWNDFQEAIGKTIVTDPIVLAALKALTGQVEEIAGETGEATHTFTEFWAGAIGGEAARGAVIILDTILKLLQDIDAQRKKNQATIPTPDLFKPQTGGIEAELERITKVMNETVAATQDGWKKAAAAAEAYRQKVQQLREQLSGRGLQAEVKALGDAFKAEEKAGTLSADALKHFADAAAKLREQGALLTPALFKIALAEGKISEEAGEMVRGLQAVDKAWEVTTDDMKETLEILANMIPAMQKVVDGWEAIARAGVGATQKVTMEDLEKIFDFKKHVPFIERYHRALDDIGDAFAALASVTHGKTQQILLDLQSLVDAAQDLGEGIARIAEGDILGGVSKLIQGGVKIFKQFFGSAGRDLVKEFAASMGGFDALHARLSQLGAEGEQLWKALTQGVGRNNPQQAQRAIDNINAALTRLDKTNQEFNQHLNGTLQQIQRLGGRLPDALKGYLAQLKEAGRLTQENIDLLEMLGDGGVNWDAVEEAAGRYGISIDKLGQAFNEAKLHKTWQQMIDDLALFADAGVDVNGLLSDMADEISAAVQRSIKFGTEIPENMRPWIQALIDSGQLLDENGDKITDISKLKFGATLQTTLEKLNATLELLLQNILGIGPALDQQPKAIDIKVRYHEEGFPSRIPGKNADIIAANPNPNEESGGEAPPFSRGGRVLALTLGGRVPAPQYAAGGATMARVLAFPAKGTDTVPAMLTPGERVLSVSQDDWLRGAMSQTAAALSRASTINSLATAGLERGAATGTDGAAYHFAFTIQAWDRSDMGRAVREQVVPVVVDAINGNDRGSRTQLTRRSKPLGSL